MQTYKKNKTAVLFHNSYDLEIKSGHKSGISGESLTEVIMRQSLEDLPYAVSKPCSVLYELKLILNT